MMEIEDLNQIKNIVDTAVKGLETSFDKKLAGTRQGLEDSIKSLETSLEKHMGNVHEEIMDIREGMTALATKEQLEDVRLELKAEIGGANNRLGAMDNRIDDETIRRKNLESRVRSVLPTLPAAPEMV